MQAEFGQPDAKQLSGKAVFGFLVDQQIDEGEPLRLVGRFRQQSATAVVIERCVWLTHGPSALTRPRAIVPQLASARKAPRQMCAALHP
jgi:hypothetical protein